MKPSITASALATTVARVKHWAAQRKFNMSPEEASEHVLQIKGSHDRPAPGTHLGTLAACPQCAVAFDLVPDQRVNGASTERLSVTAPEALPRVRKGTPR